MMKRTLALLLCLIMVLGLATPAVQASGIDNAYNLDSLMENMIVDEGSNVEFVVDGETVKYSSESETTRLPSPTELTTQSTQPVTGPFASEETVPQAVVVADPCKCVDLASAEEHDGVCKVKAPYIEITNASEKELYEQWSSYTTVEQSFMLEYLRQNSALKHLELMRLLSAPTGTASEVLDDGTTVSVEGIPEYSSLTVTEATDEVKEIVDDYVAERGKAYTQLFTYDVSVQDAEGSDWQPDVDVKMELEIPGGSLHKYAKVYVVHVDDNGVATTIPAEVTEDGKIAFETPGFSTFSGFTVDFEYDDSQFSINGMSSIKLSELFDKLKMPLEAQDVSNVVFSDPGLIKVEKLEGDWNLVSLLPFASTEKLTVTMNDGEVFEIKVTDAHRAIVTLYNDSGAVTNWDLEANSSGSNNGAVTLYMDHSYKPECGEDSYRYEHHWLIDGKLNGVSGGVLQIDLQQRTGYDYDNSRYYQNLTNVYWGIRTFKIINDAKVVIRLGGEWDNNETITLRSLTNKPMFDIRDGSLYFNLESTDFDLYPGDGFTSANGTKGDLFTSNANTRGVKIKIDGYYNGKNQANSKQCAFFYMGLGADVVAVNDVEFSNNDFRAFYCLANKMSALRIRDCTFADSIGYLNGGGGVIRIESRTTNDVDNAEYKETTDNEVQIVDLGIYDCVFTGNEAATTLTNTTNYDGGVLCCYGNLDTTTIKGCTFTNSKVKGRGGAISIGRDQTSYSMGNLKIEGCTFTGCEAQGSLGGAVAIRDGNFNYIWFEGCTFTNTTASTHGGAVDISLGDDPALIQSYVKFNRCTFTNTTATGNGGGAIRMLLCGGKPVTVSDCTFSGTEAGSHGGAVYLPEQGEKSTEAAVVGDVDITGNTFSNTSATLYGGAICVYTKTSTLDITGGSFSGCKSGTVVTVAGKKDSQGNQMYNGNGGGGAIMLARKHGTVNIGGTSTAKQTFTNCESLNNGGAIAIEGGENPTTEIQTCNIQYVEIDGCDARDSGAAISMSTVTIVNMSLKDSTIKNCSYVSGYTGNDANNNSLYDNLYTKDMDYDSIPFRTNDSHGTIRTTGATKAQLVVEGVTFKNNTSITGGGGIYWNANRLKRYAADTEGTYTFTNSLTIKNCTFEENYAFRDGGAIYVESSLTIEGGTFKNNSAQRGGAIAQQLYNNSDRMIQSGETNNLIITSYTSGSNTTKAVFDANYARKHGGAISLFCNATSSIDTTENDAAMAYPITCQILGAEIKNNRAAENGGGVYFYQPSYPADYTESQLKDSAGNPLTQAQIDAKAKLDNKEVEAYVKSLKLDGASVHTNYSGCGKDKLTTPASATGSGNGGGIYLNAKNNTTLEVLGCNVYSNSAHFGNGGGIYMTGEGGVCKIKANTAGTATVIGGASDKGNKATSSAPGTAEGQNTGNGGGIGIFIKGRIEMEGGTVSYNTAETAGGGIAVNGSTMQFDNGTVTNNAAKYGGGISLTNSGDPSTIADESLENPPALTPAWGMIFTNGTVTNNVADIGGGICVSNSSTMKLDGGKVNTNYAATKSGSSYSYASGQNGGGIAVVASSKMNIYAGEVKSNHAGSGGGITVQGGSALQMLPKTGSTAAGVVASNTVHSGGGGYGGGIYLAAKASDGNKNTLYVDNGTVELNKGYYGAGIAVLKQSEATLSGGKIYKNEGVSTACLGGGAYVYGAKLTISGAELSYNYGQNSGGAVYLRTTSSADGSVAGELSITNGTIHHNHTKSGWGGGIYMLGTGSKTTISGGKIYENYTESSGSNGGGINVEHSCQLDITGGEIYSNRAATNGGGIHAHTSATINITGGSVYGNTAPGTGGGINVYNSVTVNVNGGSIYNNTATGDGGGINCYNSSKVDIDSGFIYGNTTSANGGGIHSYSSATVNVDGGAIYNNTASGDAGGILANSSKVTITGGSIYGNIATTGTGGGVYAHTSATVEITGGDIYSNTAKTYGGGMHVSGSSNLTFKGGDIRNNTAGICGGGITVSWKSTATVGTSDDGTKIGKIMNNTASGGGGVYVESSSLTVNNGYIINNQATGEAASRVKTAYGLSGANLAGVGGGIALVGAPSAQGTFTLTGDKIAIYGNTANFAGDDVFSNGNTTKLNIPTVGLMDLAEYDFKPEGWVEDYCFDDTSYTSNGLNMLAVHAAEAEVAGDATLAAQISAMKVGRYRNTSSTERNYMLIDDAYVTGTGISGQYVNKDGAYVCMTLGVPAAADDVVVIDYGFNVAINLMDNDTFISKDDFANNVYVGKQLPTRGIKETHGIRYSTGADYVGSFRKQWVYSSEMKYGNISMSTEGYATYGRGTSKSTLAFQSEDTFAYVVKHGTTWFYAKVTIIPATTLYFEDNAAQIKYHTSEDSKETFAEWDEPWHSNGTQAQDRPGDAIISNNDKDFIYGYDEQYEGKNTFSNWTSHSVTVSRHTAVDANGDGICDECKKIVAHDCGTSAIGEKCSTCGNVKPTHVCKDTNGDYKCNTCGSWIVHQCTDQNGDYWCDLCGSWMEHRWSDVTGDNGCDACHHGLHHDCVDSDKNDRCDICHALLNHTKCTDSNKDYWCDFCSKLIAHTCVDTNKDYWCDRCGQWISNHEWVDKTNEAGVKGSDGVCDTCGYAKHHQCADANGDLKCDTCPAVQWHTCTDANKNYWCDICYVWMPHTFKDSNGDLICDTCGYIEHHQCTDWDYNNACDVCGKYRKHDCIDNKANKNFCDICGISMGTHTINARASFTFTGTGFDLIGYCSNNTGSVMVNVYKGEVRDFDNPPMDRYVASYMVDTRYGYLFNEKTGKWEFNDQNTTSLYQVPIIKADLTKVVVGMEQNPDSEDYDPIYTYKNFGYGTYSVEVYASPSFVSTEPGYWSSEFHLDAVRVYNPANVDGIYSYEYDAVKVENGNPVYSNGKPVYEKVTVSNNSSTILDAYKTDGEGWPIYTELRNMIIPQSDLNDGTIDGVIFIDGNSKPALGDYISYGPNNEVYLNPRQSIAFTMDMNNCTNVAGIHLGVRGLTGSSSVSVVAGQSASNQIEILNRSLGATDMYYDIGKKDASGNFIIADNVVVITNTGSKPIAISTVKVTHTDVPAYATAAFMFRSSSRAAEIALEILSADELVDHPMVTPERPALSFNGMVSYNVFFSAKNFGDLNADDLGLAVFSTEDTEGTIETAREVIYGATEIDGLYMISTSGIHAKNLGDIQYFRAFAKKVDGTIVYSKMVSYSAVQYATNVLAKSNDVKLKQLVVAMLNYGAAAQQFFGYNTDNLMNKDLTADDQALLANFDTGSLNALGTVDASKVGIFASTGGFTKKSPAISFKGAFEINYFFTPANAVHNGMKLYFWSEDTYNSVTELTAENADKVVDMTVTDGVYTATSDEIPAKYLDKTVYVAAVYKCGDVTYCSGVLPYSIAAYCQNPPATVEDLATATAIYGCTAKQYFGV